MWMGQRPSLAKALPSEYCAGDVSALHYILLPYFVSFGIHGDFNVAREDFNK